MRPKRSLSVLAAVVSSTGSSVSTFTPTRPPAVPLAVRSPYLNAWLQGGDSGPLLPGSWPRHWTGGPLGWQGLVAVDGVTYTWMGTSQDREIVEQTSLEYTSTQSIFRFDVAGKVELIATFLSPVYADDLARQALQFSYLTVKARSVDGAPHEVQLYIDVTGEWASGNTSETIEWEAGTSDGVAYLKFFRSNQEEFEEVDEIASWGKWYLATGSDNSLSWQIGAADDVRRRFDGDRILANSSESDYRAVDDEWPVFAFSHDLWSIADDETERVVILGLVQDHVIHFAGLSCKMEPVPGLWSSYYSGELSSVAAFYNDYEHAKDASLALDQKIQTDSVNAAGQGYATITTLAVRQTFGALQYAGNSSKPYIFLKEISSNSDIQTVDVIFPAWPIFMYLNPKLGRYLLDPLFENQESGAYPNAFAEHDLGTFPIAKGYPDGLDEPMPLEECGNMIIMTLSYAQRTGDVDYLVAHYPLLEQWAWFLMEESLIPENQLSTDDFAGTLPNQTNLALKGIIGLKAMSQIAQLTNKADSYGEKAEAYLEGWKSLAINTAANPPHTTLSYGQNDTHGLLYNLYADALLNLSFIPQDIYDMQSDFYPTVADEYGVPLDTRHTWAKSDWQMFAAAVASNSMRDMLVGKLARWVGETSTYMAMTDLYDVQTGGFPENGPYFMARPVQGGLFALLALPK